MRVEKHFKISEVCDECGIETERIEYFITHEWLSPADPSEPLLDEEDLARIRLIIHLQSEFGVNDESIPIILNLIDQIHCLQRKPRAS